MFPLLSFSKRKILLKSFRYFSSSRELGNVAALEKPVLYGDLASPPVRCAMMTASYLGIDVNYHKIDLFLGENKSESYTKINPLQKVPALAVGSEVIKDSNAIALYFCNISNDKELYPNDALMKARVDEMLFFNADCMFPLDREIYTSYFAGKWPINKEHIKQWDLILDYLETVLLKNKWLAGEKMTLSDICCVASVSSYGLLQPPLEKHSKVNDWIKKMQALPFYNINLTGLERLRHYVQTFNQDQK